MHVQIPGSGSAVFSNAVSSKYIPGITRALAPRLAMLAHHPRPARVSSPDDETPIHRRRGLVGFCFVQDQAGTLKVAVDG